MQNRSSFALAFALGCACLGGFAGGLASACSSGNGGGGAVDAGAGDASTGADTAPVEMADASDPGMQSCMGITNAPGITDCGPKGTESCCTSKAVSGGTFLRDYDGFTHDAKGNPATISDFRLDRFEVTVGRFREFVVALLAGYAPPAGSGKHTHLNGGKGLVQPETTTAAKYEAGWDPKWMSTLATKQTAWDTNLGCSATYQTWTPEVGMNESSPITCASWYEAYAFCIWDGAFLPSEAEWTYAAAGGMEQRAYPWSPASTSSTPPTIECTDANFGGAKWPMTACNKTGATKVGMTPMGDGKYGQADLGGNVWEWTADWSSGYISPCTDCADLDVGTKARAIRGGGFGDDAANLLASYGLGSTPDTRDYTLGFRCARIP